MEVTIRRAVKEDCREIMDLVSELAEFERAAHEVSVQFDHFVESGFGRHPVWWSFVATVRINNIEKIVGIALYYIRYSTWKGQRMYLEDIVVTHEMRKAGIGSKLMDAIIDEAREKKFSGIMWQVLDWNEAAINFYKKYNTTFDGEWINCSVELN